MGAATAGRGEVDWLVWFATQTGRWYQQRHRGRSLTIEGGHQWKAAWQRWLRGGYLYASGDPDATDDRGPCV